ncbi:MAG TPA: FAD-dependent thymidylate synthase [Caldilineae bacterium]|nr:FAD-dependent thymidylate synthase [Caldilineae bacterium]
MEVKLLSCTHLNPALPSLEDLGDVSMMLESPVGTEQERLVEFAARVCYRSTDKMGRNPGFIQARVREGHEDIVEHVTFVVHVTGVEDDDPLQGDGPVRWRMTNRHLDVTPWEGGWVVSGNARVWLDLFRKGLALDVLPLVRPLAPAIYAEFAEEGASPEGGRL